MRCAGFDRAGRFKESRRTGETGSPTDTNAIPRIRNELAAPMNVVLVNESQSKALIRSRRVLSRFLPQIGAGTWAGLISSEGLADLERALRETASKSTSVACHQVVSRHRMELKWIVGSKRHFDSEGRYAYRTRSAVEGVPDFVGTHTPAEQFALSLVRLAALFHDLGKASKAFQAKLARGEGAETLRHDLLSMLMVSQSLGDAPSDKAWLEALAQNPSAACACVTDQSLLNRSDVWFQVIQKTLDQNNGALLATREELVRRFSHAPGLMTVLWLVLTHHRLPEGTDSGEQLDVQPYLNIPESSDGAGTANPVIRKFASLEDCLTPAAGTLPWADDDWQHSVQSVAKAALRALACEAEMAPATACPVQPSSWPVLAAHLLRPSLIQADHLASLLAKDNGRFSTKAKGYPFANLVGPGTAGDSLCTHLLKVQRLARRFQNLAMTPQRFPTAELPADSNVLSTGLPEKFRWQERLGQTCQQQPDVPTFIAIIAETGAGKTLGGLRAAYALRQGRLRLTMALGLRSLTWQTAQAALSDAKLSPTDLMVAVGQSHALTLADKAQRQRFGSSSAAGSTDDFALASICQDASATLMPVTSIPTPERLTWLEGLCSTNEAEALWGSKSLNLIAAPVLACTADHLVKATTLLRGGDVKACLRLTTSDLLLDEIDSYSPQDLQSIGKLALMAGLGGRNLIVMSATASPAVVEGLFGAWNAGLQARRGLTALPAGRVIFCSHLGAPQELQPHSCDEFGQQWRAFANDLCRTYADDALCPPRRRARILSFKGCTSTQMAYEQIFEGVERLHKTNHEVDAQTGRRVSIGFIRFNKAKTAWRYANYLANRSKESAGVADYRVVAYHAKFPRTHLGVLDAVLGRLCTRKGARSPLTDCAELREVVNRSSAPDVVVIVCTTTLIETGRDFDFDWCILEPRSTRGEVQAVGRVRRHRPQAYDGVNVALMEYPLAFYEGTGPVWGAPGIEDHLGRNRFMRATSPNGVVPSLMSLPTSVPAPRALGSSRKGGRPSTVAPTLPSNLQDVPVREAQEALPIRAWEHKMDAQACLYAPSGYEQDRIGSWEQFFQAQHLTAPLKDYLRGSQPPSLAWYVSSLAPLTRVHASDTPFRKSSGNQAVFLPPLPGSTAVRFVDPVRGLWLPASEAVVHSVSSTRLLLPDLDVRASVLTDNRDHNLIGVSLRRNEGGPAYTKLTWSPELGFLEGLVNEL